MKHKHHITPRYRGGGDEPENLIEVSIPQHIMWHFANWKLWGDYRDKVAYKLLANTDASEEMELSRLQASREAISNLPPEFFVERGKKISKVKSERAHITREQTKARHDAGNFYTEDGARRVQAARDRANASRAREVICVDTGETWQSLKECARSIHIGINTLRHSVRGRIPITRGEHAEKTFQYVI